MATSHSKPDDDVDRGVFDSYRAARRRRAEREQDVPIETRRSSRARTRRGGPRTPIPLLPVIALAGGIAIAYVSQTAHLTKSTYQASDLQVEQATLRQQDARLTDELDRLRSSARIDAAAQRLGMQPPASWAYVPASSAHIDIATAPGAHPQPAGDAMQQLVALLSGQYGPTQAEASAP